MRRLHALEPGALLGNIWLALDDFVFDLACEPEASKILAARPPKAASESQSSTCSTTPWMTMPNDEPPSTRKAAENDAAQPKRAATPLKRPSIFAIPEPVKRVFNNFPLTTYEPNELPARAPKQRDEPTLHVFATPEDASRGRPSFNPGCLKWQVRTCG